MNPRHNRTVVKAHRQIELHGHGPPDTLNNPHEIRSHVAGRQEVNEPDYPFSALNLRLQDQCTFAIAPIHLPHLRLRSDAPGTVVLISEQGGEEGGGVEAGEAQPIDGTVLAHQGGRLRISDQTIVLYGQSHIPPLLPCQICVSAERRTPNAERLIRIAAIGGHGRRQARKSAAASSGEWFLRHRSKGVYCELASPQTKIRASSKREDRSHRPFIRLP